MSLFSKFQRETLVEVFHPESSSDVSISSGDSVFTAKQKAADKKSAKAKKTKKKKKRGGSSKKKQREPDLDVVEYTLVQPFDAEDNFTVYKTIPPQYDSSDDQLIEDLQAIDDARERKRKKQRSPVGSVSSNGSSEDSGVGSFHRKLESLANSKFGRFIGKRPKSSKKTNSKEEEKEVTANKGNGPCEITLVQPFKEESDAEEEDDGIELINDVVEYTPVVTFNNEENKNVKIIKNGFVVEHTNISKKCVAKKPKQG